VHDWPLISVGSTSDFENMETPLVADCYSLYNTDKSFSVEDVWDGVNVNSGNVRKWVASKLQNIATYISV